ncbi:MAG TPA: ferrochelatase [Candidatus Binataceae bacterium]|nr:ferrochelatase [Candidatus Binataceae bacterium]
MDSPRAKAEAVMLIGFGGPNSTEEIRPFLDRVLKGRPVPRERYEEVVHHYEVMGGRSPYNELTMRQAAALRERLKRDGYEVPVVVGMRNAAPFSEDALNELILAGVRRVVGFVLAAYRCEASWDRYLAEVEEARKRIGAAAPDVNYPAAWHTDRRYIAAVAARAREALARLTPDDRERAELVFTAHSIPLAMAARSPYVAQFEEAARLTATAVGSERWRIAYQSRSGSPRDPWLEPDIGAVIASMINPAVVVPLGFLTDHVEVLYDLDIEARAIAERSGVRMERAGTVGDAPEFIAMMAAIVEAIL